MSEPERKYTGFARLAEITRAKEEAAKHTPPVSSTLGATPKTSIKPTPDIKSSPDIKCKEPLQIASDDIMSSPDISAPPDIMSVRSEHWTAYPNDISDRILRTLELSDQAILLRLFRLTRGFHRETCKVTAETLAEACNVTSRQIPRSTQRLVARGLIEILGHDFNSTNKKERGTIYRVCLPPAADIKSRNDIKSPPDIKSSPDIMSPIKENTLKQTHTNTEGVGVGVGSNFSLKQCQRYAEHLRSSGQGINNPGGYATKIHRSGEADELIAAFLTPARTAEVIDASQCPDCRGSGFWEPGGAGKGVAKCKHEHLP